MTSPAPTPQSQVVWRKMLAGGFWSLIDVIGSSVLATALVLYLAATIGPEEYGLVSVALGLIMILEVVVTHGFSLTVVQKPEVTEDHFRAAFWANLAVGVALTLAVAAGAPLVAVLSGDDRLEPLFQMLSLCLVLSALTAVPTERLRREFRFRWLAMRPICGNIAGGAVGIALVHNGLGLWSLVAFYLVRNTVVLCVVIAGAGWPSYGLPRWSSVTGIVKFGLHAVGARMVDVANQRLPVLLAGLFLGPAAAGYVRIAEQIVGIITLLVMTPLNRVALPGFCRVQHDRAGVRRFYLSMVRLASATAFPMAGFAVLTVPTMLTESLGTTWEPAAQVAQFMLPSIVGITLFFNLGTLLLAIDRSRLALRQAIVQFAIDLACYLILIPFGIIAAGGAYALRVYLGTPYRAGMLRRVADISLKDLVAPAFPALAATAAAVLGAGMAGEALAEGLPPFAIVAAQAAIGIVLYGVCLRLLWPSVVADVWSHVPAHTRGRLVRAGWNRA
jgi:PST family polysaccharide transporter